MACGATGVGSSDVEGVAVHRLLSSPETRVIKLSHPLIEPARTAVVAPLLGPALPVAEVDEDAIKAALDLLFFGI